MGICWRKVEPDETKQAALIRECPEELGIALTVGDVFTEVTHNYPELLVHLTLFHASIASGTPQLLEHHDMRWIAISEIDQFSFCPADIDMLEKIKTTAY